MNDKNIYQRINAVMKKISYVQKDKAISGGGQNYKAVTHDNVTAMIRGHLVEEGIVVQLEQLKGELLIRRDLTKDIKMHLYQGSYAISFVNIDDPQDKATVTIDAHAADNGDKAPGKASSYATKYAMLKMFSIETGENEESRNYEAPEYTKIQKDELDELLEKDDSLGYVIFSKTVGNDVMTALNGSFTKGTISMNKAKMKKLDLAGWGILKHCAEDVGRAIENEDEMGIAEVIDDMDGVEKRLLSGLLTQEQINYLKERAELS